MSQLFAMTRFLREIRRFLLRRSSRFALLFWPVTCCALALLIWVAVAWKISADQATLRQTMQDKLATATRVHAGVLQLQLQQIDQLSLQFKREWQRAGGQLDAAALREASTAAAPGFAGALVTDAGGVIVAATDQETVGRSAATRSYFQAHAQDVSAVLKIGPPERGGAAPPRLPLSRRLEHADGSFAGVLTLFVSADFLTLALDAAVLGQHGLLAVLGRDGMLLASREAANSAAAPVVGATAAPAAATPRQSVQPAVRAEVQPTVQPPQFVLPGAQGMLRLEALPWTADRRPRLVGWQPLANFNLTAVAAIDEAEALADQRQRALGYRYAAAAGSAVLLLFAALATFFAVRLEWRNRVDHDVSSTYRIATEGSNEGFYMMRPIYDRQGAIIDWEVNDCNEVGASFLGPRRAALLGSRMSTFYQGSIFDAVMRVYQAAIDHGVFEDEYEVPSDSPLALRWMHRRLVHLDTGVAVTLRDISELKAHEHDLIRLGNEDALTTLPNRHWMMQFLPLALSRAVASQTRTALLFIDLDGFKIINDSCGHAVGDQLLQAVALRIKALLRPSDQVVRIGGDEFLIIIENVTDDAAVAPVAQRVIDTVSTPFELSHGPHVVGASIGISIFPRDGADSGELLRHADIAMYAAKASGKGRYRFYEAELHEDLAQRASTEELLRSAIAQGAFTTMYQPRIETATGNIVGLQALVRWRRADGDLALPAEFLGLAEETGLIMRLGELVLDQVCAQLAAWRAQQLPLVPVSINLSPRQFSSRFVAIVRDTMARYEIDPGLLAFEVRESCIIGADGRIAPELHSLHALGVEVMMDDFSISHRALSTLRGCGIRTLKVDRALTAQLGNLRQGDVFYRAILSTAHAMGLTVVAEGVETDAQFVWLRAQQCDQVTGYLVAQPMQAPAVPALLLSGWRMLAQPMSA